MTVENSMRVGRPPSNFSARPLCFDCESEIPEGATLCFSCIAHRADGHEPVDYSVSDKRGEWCHGAGPGGFNEYRLALAPHPIFYRSANNESQEAYAS